jgi:hypothetical protein
MTEGIRAYLDFDKLQVKRVELSISGRSEKNK